MYYVWEISNHKIISQQVIEHVLHMGPVQVTTEEKQEGRERLWSIHYVAGMGYMFFMLLFSSLHNLIRCCHFTDGKTEAQGNNLCLVMEVIFYRVLWNFI